MLQESRGRALEEGDFEAAPLEGGLWLRREVVDAAMGWKKDVMLGMDLLLEFREGEDGVYGFGVVSGGGVRDCMGCGEVKLR